MEGLRWSGTADLTFHPWAGLFVSAGGGYGGLMVDSFLGFFSAPCTGTGPAVGAKAGWLFPVGSLFATGPVVGTQMQWVHCAKGDSQGFETEFEEPIGPLSTGTWRHRSVHIGWSLAWR